ncbi:unnamed protein product [Symbiodinium microadriaticum]|nr:unnamed protein product [Symbiodinium microadriaticum]
MLPVASPLPSRAVTPKSVATSKSLKVATHGGWMGPQCTRIHDVCFFTAYASMAPRVLGGT